MVTSQSRIRACVCDARQRRGRDRDTFGRGSSILKILRTSSSREAAAARSISLLIVSNNGAHKCGYKGFGVSGGVKAWRER